MGKALEAMKPESKRQGDPSLNMQKDQTILPIPGNVEEWEKLIARMTPHDPKNRWYCRPDIPQNKLDRAIRKYGSGLRHQDVLALGDSTMFGSGESGCLLTADGVCCRVAWGGRMVPWADIVAATAVGTEGIQLRLRQGKKVRISCGQFMLIRDRVRDLISLVAASNRSRANTA